MSTPTFPDYKHWKVHHNTDDILLVACDRAGEDTNSLSEAVIQELGEIIAYAEQTRLKGLIISSAKPGSFILGADIREFDSFDTAEQVTEKIREGHSILSRLENLQCHTVATVHGFCLGGRAGAGTRL